MSKHYGAIAFTDAVVDVQREHGSDGFYGRKRVQGKAVPGIDALTDDEREYLAERDGFYLASVSETGWPYVQFRGGPPGFLRVVDDHTIGWADFRGGNLQYITTGNVGGDDRVALIVLDYAQRRRLKIFGHARVVTVADDAALVESFADPRYAADVGARPSWSPSRPSNGTASSTSPPRGSAPPSSNHTSPRCGVSWRTCRPRMHDSARDSKAASRPPVSVQWSAPAN